LTTPMKAARKAYREVHPPEKKAMTMEAELSKASTPPRKGSTNRKQQTTMEKEDALQESRMNEKSKDEEQKK